MNLFAPEPYTHLSSPSRAILKLECASDSPGVLVKTQPAGTKPRVSESVDLRWGLIITFSNKFPGDVDTAGPRPDFEKHYSRTYYVVDFQPLFQILEPLPLYCLFPYTREHVQISVILTYKQKSPLKMGVVYFSFLIHPNSYENVLLTQLSSFPLNPCCSQDHCPLKPTELHTPGPAWTRAPRSMDILKSIFFFL